MKGKIFLIVAAIVVALALTAFVVFPTTESGKQEKVQTTENTSIGEICEHHCTCSDCSGSGWIKVDDEGCNKCKITELEYTCGKCGSSMKSLGKPKLVDNMKNLQYTFKCTNDNCKHECTYKTPSK